MNLTVSCPPVTAIRASLVKTMKRMARCVEPSATFGHVAYHVPTSMGVAKCVTRLEVNVTGGRIIITPADITVTTADSPARQEASLLFLAEHATGIEARRLACNMTDVEYMLVRSLTFARTGQYHPANRSIPTKTKNTEIPKSVKTDLPKYRNTEIGFTQA